MPDSQSFEPPDPIERPLCSNCGWTMWIASVEKHEEGHEKHTLKCTRCETEQVMIVRL